MTSKINDSYNENGFYLAESFFSADEMNVFLDEINNIVNRCIGEGAELPDNALTLSNRLEKDDYDKLDFSKKVGFHYDEVTDDNGNTTLVPRSIINLFLSGDIFHNLAFNERILDLVEKVTGNEIRFFNSRCFLKPPQGLGTKWHRDIEFFDCKPNPIINCLIFLEDQKRSNGCLKVVPRSHKKQLRGNLDIEKEFGFKPTEPFGELPEQLYLECPAGTVVILDHFTLHGSETNKSEVHRKLLSLGYAGPHVQNMKGEKMPNTLVRGTRQESEVIDES